MKPKVDSNKKNLDNTQTHSIVTSLFLINIQSLANKTSKLYAYLNKFNYGIVCLSEHWILNKEALRNINLGSYTLATSYCRLNNIHGGVAIYVKNHIKC